MSSVQIPIRRNGEFFPVFDSLDCSTSSISNPLRFFDGRYLKNSGTNVSSNAIITNFNCFVTNSIESEQNINTFTPSNFSTSMI